MTAPKRRAEDGDSYSMYLGIGSAHGIAGPDDEPADPPGIWLPEHRSGSRFGGWRKQPVGQTVRRPIGFRRP